MGFAESFCASLGAQPVTYPALWTVIGAPCAFHLYMGFPPQAYIAPWTLVWVPFGGYLWVRHPPPAALMPSVWSRGVSSFDSRMGSQLPTPLAGSIFPYPMDLPPPYSSVPSALSRDAFHHLTQVQCQTPASSASGAAARDPSRAVYRLKKGKAPPPELASRFSIWAPMPPSSPELCPLPVSPSTDPQPYPRLPRPPRLSCRARRRLFEL
ncbi:proline-rich protein 23E [Tamandua tetradactyla]|uniref:proline-rich protein 23E n=1 Tax=Tamandua tetradactyla TaxID=48850 RepID=UPI0040545EA1